MTQSISATSMQGSFAAIANERYIPTDNENFTELTEQRTASSKVYLLESKLTEAVIFGTAVHYLENGKYRDIDNSLQLSTNRAGKQKYVNKANSFIAEISPTLDSDWIVSVSKGKYRLSWSVEGLQQGKTGTAKTPLNKASWQRMGQGQKRRELPDISSDVTYVDVFPNVDLQYILIGESIKENLILKGKSAINQFTQRIKA